MTNQLNEIKLRVRVMGPIRHPEDYRTGSSKEHNTQIPGISLMSGLELKSGRREIQAIKFVKFHYSQDAAEAWMWRNYNIIRVMEAELNGEPYPKDLEI